DTAPAAHPPRQAAIVHRVQKMRAGVRRAAPVVAHRAVREMIIDLARMCAAAFADELEDSLRLLHPFGGPTDARRILILLSGLGHRGESRMHQRVYRTRHETI